jgi:hypothetical protein
MINQQDLAEEYGDGYRNEFQRALAWSQMSTDIPNDRAKAEALVAQGKTVVLALEPVYCRITDGLMGTAVTIASVGDDYETAVGSVLNNDPDNLGDTRYEVLPHQVVVKEAVVIDLDDDIPF